MPPSILFLLACTVSVMALKLETSSHTSIQNHHLRLRNQESNSMEANAKIIPVATMQLPRIRTRGKDWLELEWDAPESPVDRLVAAPVVYNLILDGVSVYAGTLKSATQGGLDLEACYEFQVAAYINGAWTQFSRALRASTYNSQVAPPLQRDIDYSSLRAQLLKDSIGGVLKVQCDLESMTGTSYADGSSNAVEYVGRSDSLSPIGLLANEFNCLVSHCQRGTATTKSLRRAITGSLLMRMDDGEYMTRSINIPADGNIYQFTDPLNGVQNDVFDLQGCHANDISNSIGPFIRRTGAAGDHCLELNCTASLIPTYLCESDISRSNPAQGIDNWRSAFNRAAMGHHIIQRYEVAMRATVVNLLDDDKAHTVYEQAGYRESWMLTWLSELPLNGSCPHFPVLFASTRCKALPPKWADPTGVDPKGLLSPYVHGAATAYNVKQMKGETGILKTFWSASIVEAYGTDLHTVFTSFKDYGISNKFLRNVAFQIIFALGSARDAFGLYHNDLLNLKSIKLTQIPEDSPTGKPNWCYEVAGPSTAVVNEVPAADVSEKTGNDDEEEDMQQHCLSHPRDPCCGGKEGSYWCMVANDVDGFRVKIHNFANAAMSKKQFEWWLKGYTFPNNRWGDDMQDVAVIICDLLGSKVAEIDTEMLSFCESAKNGEYYDNPFDALKHPVFIPMLRTTFPDAVEVYSYKVTNSTMGSLKFEDWVRPLQVSAAVVEEVEASGLYGLEAVKEAREESKARIAGIPREGKNGDLSGSLKMTDKTGTSKISSVDSRTDASGALDADVESETVASAAAPWIVMQQSGMFKLQWSPPPEAADPNVVILYNVLLNGVSVYSGTSNEFFQAGLDDDQCYRVNIATFVNGAWSSSSSNTYVNDCSAYRLMQCRNRPCGV